MPRPLTIALAAAGVVAGAVVSIVMLRLDLGRSSAPQAEPAPVVAAAPAPAVPHRVETPSAGPPSSALPALAAVPSVPKRREPGGAAEPVAPPIDEAPLMEKLRALGAADPAQTIALARDGNKRFPDSADAPERAWMVVKSLTSLEKYKDARDEAEIMVKQYPGTSWALDVQRHLLSNPLDSGGGGP